MHAFLAPVLQVRRSGSCVAALGAAQESLLLLRNEICALQVLHHALDGLHRFMYVCVVMQSIDVDEPDGSVCWSIVPSARA